MKPTSLRNRLPQRASLAALLLLTASALRAQEVPKPSTADPAATPPADAAVTEEPVLELSPFEVTTDRNEGYMATSSLAGSRLNTALRDISSPIQAITPQFLQDTGVTKVQDLLLYTTNTEAAGENGNFYGASGGDAAYARDQQLRPQNQTRVRGLFGADLTRDFWQTNIPLDSYNVQGVEIQRGPNSILYGLGSPAGIINYTLKTPLMSDNKYLAEIRFDSEGSLRGSVDLNQVVKPGVLAIRVNALDEDHKYRQNGKYEKNRRVTLSPRWTPKMAEGVYTQFTLNYEKGKQDANQPTLTPPIDFMSNWYERMGKYVRPDTYNGAPAALNIGSYYTGSNGGGISWFDTYAVVFADPNSSKVGGAGIADLIRQRGGSPFGNFVGIANLVDNSNQPTHILAQKSYYQNNPQAMAIIDAMEQSTGRAFSGFNGWQGQQILDTSVFDYWNNDVAGPNNTTWHDFETLNFSATQTYLDGRAGIELVYDKQEYEDGFNRYLINPNRISIDINPTLRQEINADGTRNPAAANPNFGRPFAFSADANTSGTEARRNVEMRENYRMTAFYKLNLEKMLDRRNWLTRIIGEQTFTGVASQQRYHHYNEDWQLYNVGESFGVYGLGEGTAALHYLNSAVDPKGATGIKGLGITGLSAVHTPPNNVSVQILDQDSRAPNVNQFSIVNADLITANTPEGQAKLWTAGMGDNRTKTTTRAFIWQGRLFDDTVIPLFGLRKDDFKKQVKGTQTTQANGRQAPDGRDGVGATVGRPDPRSPLWKYDPANDLAYSGTTRTYGLMIHSPEIINRHLPWGSRISVGYNEASNVNPSDVGFNILRSQLPPQSGTSKDYTVLISTLNDRLTMRATWYKTIQKNATFDSGGGIQPGAIAESFVRTMNGMMVETQTGGNRRLNTTPEFIINKWFFGGNPTQGSSGYFTPGQWKNADAATRAAMLQNPMLTRAAAATWGDPATHIAPANGTVVGQPPISDEETDYRRAWFEARTDAQWYRPLEAAMPGFGQQFWTAFQFTRTPNALDTTGGATGPYAGSPYRGYGWGSSNPPSFKNTTDIVARGVELEATANLTKNWRVTLNASRAEAENSNILDEGMKNYYAAMVKVAKDGFSLADVQSGGNNWVNGSDYWNRTGFAQIDEWGDEAARFPDAQFYKFDGVTFGAIDNGAGTGGNHQMLGEKWVEDTERDYLGALAAEGRSIREIRKWRFNMVTSYDFASDSRLKGLGVGGAVRWQDKTNIGYYPKFANGGWVADLDKPIPGPDEWNFDAWVYYRYKITKKINATTQLNLRNVFNNKNLIPINANPDGTVGQYRLGGTFAWELSTRFEF